MCLVYEHVGHAFLLRRMHVLRSSSALLMVNDRRFLECVGGSQPPTLYYHLLRIVPYAFAEKTGF